VGGGGGGGGGGESDDVRGKGDCERDSMRLYFQKPHPWKKKSSSFFGTPSFGRLPFPASRKFYLGLAARYDARLRTQFLYKCKALQRERAAEVSQTEEK